MVFYRRARRTAAAALAMLLIFTLMVPGLTAKAESSASYSAELKLNLGDRDIQAKLWADLENNLFAVQAQMTEGGRTGTGLGLFLGEKALVLQNSPLLGGTYGIDLENLTKNLPDSVFAPDSGSALALDQAIYDALMKGQEGAASIGIIGGADGPTSILVTGGLGTGLQGLITILAKSASLKLTPGELELESGTIKTTETIVSFDPEGLASLAEQVLTGTDEETQAALARLLTALFGSGEETEEAPSADDAAVSLRDTLIRADARLTLSLAMDKKAKQLVAATAALSWEGNTTTIRAVFTGEIYSLTLDREGGEPLAATLNLDENTDSALAFRFCITQGDTPSSQISFRWDKAAGTYVFTTRNDDRTDELTGTIQTAQDTIVITADTANGQALGETSLTLRRGDPASLPEFQDIITMSEAEILGILQKAIASVLTVLKEAA